MFTPVVVEPQALTLAPPAKSEPKPSKRGRRSGGGGIELKIDGVVVRVGRGAQTRTIAAVIKALKAPR